MTPQKIRHKRRKEIESTVWNKTFISTNSSLSLTWHGSNTVLWKLSETVKATTSASIGAKHKSRLSLFSDKQIVPGGMVFFQAAKTQ